MIDEAFHYDLVHVDSKRDRLAITLAEFGHVDHGQGDAVMLPTDALSGGDG